MTEPLTIFSGQGGYRVEFAGIDAAIETVLSAERPVVVVDSAICNLHGQALLPLLSNPWLTLAATESEKTLDGGVKVLMDFMQRHECDKRTTLIAVGGGIIQDIVAFTAHLYYRGVSWIFLPTTLLAMADSCIGAKCGINLNGHKNQLGVFHAPKRVVIATDFVRTLLDRDVASGYGEILKLMLTGSQTQFDDLVATAARDWLRGPRLERFIRESLVVKQRFIESDEYELGPRRILNYGHTFGHSLEAITNFAVPHGLAVAWGIDLANFISFKRGMLHQFDFQATHDFIGKHLACRIDVPLTARALVDGARHDKKASGGRVDLVLSGGPGRLEIVNVPFDDRLDAEVAEYLEDHDVFCGR